MSHCFCRLVLPLIVGFLILANPTARAAVIHDELFDGDLSNLGAAPSSLGVLAAGFNLVIGTKASLSDEDYLTFTIAPGFELSSVVLSTLYFDDFVSYYLHAGNTTAAPLLESINLPSAFGPLDLLLFDTAPGAQPAGDYALRVQMTVLDVPIGGNAWSATFVVTPIPVPAAAGLFAGALGALAWLRRRTHPAG